MSRCNVWRRCRRDLSDPAHAARHISDIAFAWGFNDLAHFQPDLSKQRFGAFAARMARAPGAVTHLPIGPACCRGTYAAPRAATRPLGPQFAS